MSITLYMENNLRAVSNTLKADLPAVITEINTICEGKDLDQIKLWEEGYDNILGRSGYPLCAVASGS